MRRNYSVSESFIDYLKSLGCVLYLPLGENDYHDYIGGHDLVFTGSGSMSWDSNVGMTYISFPNTVTTVSTLQSDTLNAQSFPSDEVTAIVTFKRKTTTNGKYISPFCISSNSYNIYPCPTHNGSSNIGVWGDVTHDSGLTFNSSGRTWFEDGGILKTDSTGTQTPSYWSNYNWYIASIGSARGTSCYFSNIMIFNRVLTLEEYRKVNGY